MVVKRGTITVCNILFPPLAVFLLCGAGEDLLINSVLFLLAVIPSHIHGFYVSFTYFQRKRKVRKGEYPGKWRPMIYSEKIQNGGASSSDVLVFKKERALEKREKQKRKVVQGGRTRRLLRRVFHRSKPEIYSPLSSEKYYTSTSNSPLSTINRQSSGFASDNRRISRRTSQRYSRYSDAGEVLQVPHRHTSIRSNPHRNRRSQVVEYVEQPRPMRQQSVRNQYQNGGTAVQQNNLTRAPSAQIRAPTMGRNGEAFADYVSRPTLPSRPGTSYRDDIDRWRQRVPVEVR